MQLDDIHAAQAQVKAWQHQLTGLNLHRREADRAEALNELAQECKFLLTAIENVLEPSALLKLPKELLLRVLSHLDAKTLGTLESVARLFRNELVDQAVELAAVAQHGEQLAALRPQRLSEARRLWCLELGFTVVAYVLASLHVSRSSVGTRCQMTT